MNGIWLIEYSHASAVSTLSALSQLGIWSRFTPCTRKRVACCPLCKICIITAAFFLHSTKRGFCSSTNHRAFTDPQVWWISLSPGTKSYQHLPFIYGYSSYCGGTFDQGGESQAYSQPCSAVPQFLTTKAELRSSIQSHSVTQLDSADPSFSALSVDGGWETQYIGRTASEVASVSRSPHG